MLLPRVPFAGSGRGVGSLGPRGERGGGRRSDGAGNAAKQNAAALSALPRYHYSLRTPTKGGAMTQSARDIRSARLAAAEQELKSLAERGVITAGDGFSPIVLVKGELNDTERSGGELLAGADGQALRAALLRLGYAPEDFCALAAVAGTGDPAVVPAVPEGAPLTPELFREALEALDPEAVVLLDEPAAALMREAYADALSQIEQFEVAMLEPGLVAHVLGRRVLALGGFEAALADPAAKQRVWAYLKQLPPLGAPY